MTSLLLLDRHGVQLRQGNTDRQQDLDLEDTPLTCSMLSNKDLMMKQDKVGIWWNEDGEEKKMKQ